MLHKPVVLFVNHNEPNCGVYQYFLKLVTPLIGDNWYYIETNNEWEHDYWIKQLHPSNVVYNFYFSGVTMPWLSDAKIGIQRAQFKQYAIHHEGTILNKGFDGVFHQDPTNTDTAYINLPRPIPKYTPYPHINSIPIFGTFGFGLGGKGFDRVVRTVNEEYERAIIRMNIPYAHFGDSDGTGARWWANHCRSQAAVGIDVQVTHDLLPEKDLLDWLAYNDVNCFFYDDNHGRGLSGTVDYALAVRKPIAMTKSEQFKHMWNDKCFIEYNTLKTIATNGIQHLERYHTIWTTAAIKEVFESTFERNTL